MNSQSDRPQSEILEVLSKKSVWVAFFVGIVFTVGVLVIPIARYIPFFDHEWRGMEEWDDFRPFMFTGQLPPPGFPDAHIPFIRNDKTRNQFMESCCNAQLYGSNNFKLIPELSPGMRGIFKRRIYRMRRNDGEIITPQWERGGPMMR